MESNRLLLDYSFYEAYIVEEAAYFLWALHRV